MFGETASAACESGMQATNGIEQRAERMRRLEDLAAQITELAGHLNAGTYRFLRLLVEFDRQKGWAQEFCLTCAHWLNFRCGIDLGAAREKVRVAHALEHLPAIADSMARGQLSYSKVRAITRIADTGNEDYLLNIALHGTAEHVERLVRGFRRAKEAQELSREARQQASRRVTYCHDESGSLILKASLPAEIGALVLKALDAALALDPLPRPQPVCTAEDAVPTAADVSAETSPSYSVRRADALGRIAESFLAHGAEALSGADRHQIVVHVDAETLKDRIAGRCELEDGPALAAATAQRLACDASLVALTENANGEPLDVGRKTRTLPPAIRRALAARDRGCRFPGCTPTRYVDGHHIRHWAQGGETKLSNLITLCRVHHRVVHELGVEIHAPADDVVQFVRRDGRPFGAPVSGPWPVYSGERIVSDHRALGIEIDRDTARSLWRGERMDYGIGVQHLFERCRVASFGGRDGAHRPARHTVLGQHARSRVGSAAWPAAAASVEA